MARGGARGTARRVPLRGRRGRRPRRPGARQLARSLGAARTRALVDLACRRRSVHVPLAALLLGLGRIVRHDRRREIVIALLRLVWVFNVLGVVVLVVSLVASLGRGHHGPPAAVQRRRGGPPTRSLSGSPSGSWTAAGRSPAPSHPRRASPTSSSRRTRTLSSPETVGRRASGTTSTCRSPTRSPSARRTRCRSRARAKRLMAAESMLSGVTVLLVAARAVNILP